MPHAEAIAIKGDTIQSVGSNSEIKKLVGENTEVIDLDGKFVMPGFIESHAHFLGLGNSMMILDLNSAVNWDEIIEFQVKCLKVGANGIGIPDLIIAQNAKVNNCAIYSLDKHFRLLSQIMKLKLY